MIVSESLYSCSISSGHIKPLRSLKTLIFSIKMLNFSGFHKAFDFPYKLSQHTTVSSSDLSQFFFTDHPPSLHDTVFLLIHQHVVIFLIKNELPEPWCGKSISVLQTVPNKVEQFIYCSCYLCVFFD